jgi:cytoskeletal protein RodZ
MRKPVLILCLAVLGLSFALIWFKKTGVSKVEEPKQAIAPQSNTNGLAQMTETSISPTVNRQPEPASTINSAVAEATARLLAQIQAGLKSDDSSDHIRVFDEFLPALVKIDPAAAAAFAQTPGLENWRSEIMRVVAQSWADKNPAAAIGWATQLANSTEHDAAISYISLKAGESDPAWGVQALENNGAGSYQSAALENLAQRWAEKDFAAASAWVANQPAGEDRDRLVARIALAQSMTDPASAARTIVEQMSAGTAQKDAALMVLNQWARQDLPGATSWVNKFPEGDLFNQANQILSGVAAYQTKSKATP